MGIFYLFRHYEIAVKSDVTLAFFGEGGKSELLNFFGREP